MGIFASGRLLVNPDFVRSASAPDLLFVLTHETVSSDPAHPRARPRGPTRSISISPTITSSTISCARNCKWTQIPAGGLDWPGARLLSAEKILERDSASASRAAQKSWDPRGSAPMGDPGDGRG